MMKTGETNTVKTWATEILALDPLTGWLTRYIGPNVRGRTRDEATQFCQVNGLGYCRVTNEFIAEFDDDDETSLLEWLLNDDDE